MKIEVTTTFLEGRDRFEAGDIRTVPDEDGARFVASGWAAPLGGEPGPAAVGEVSLDIHKGVIGTGDSNG